MRIRDIILIGLVILWLVIVLRFFLKKKGTCIGCSGAQCGSCMKSKKKRK